MTVERTPTEDGGPIDVVPQHNGVIDAQWLGEHLNMEIALRAYEKGVADASMGPTDLAGRDTPEKMAILNGKVTVQHTGDAIFPLTDEEIKATLCLFPESWLQHARLKTVTVRPPAHFVTKKFGDHYFVAGIEEIRDGRKFFNGEELTDGYYAENGLTAPGSDFHYAPGQYMGKTEDILLFQEPSAVQASVLPAALKQYGRELIVHEFLHAVLREDADLVFLIDGLTRDYASVLQEFYEICQRERSSVSEYSELYNPLLSRPFNLSDFWVKMGLQEELGELLSSAVLGWGATPQGEAKKVQQRDFGGTAFRATGKSEKLAFAEKLLTAIVAKKEVAMIQDDTAGAANRSVSGTDTNS